MGLDAIEKNVHANGLRLTYFERGIAFKGKKPTLLFLHATGFHARVWDKIVDGLGDFHSISVDQRGHGRTEKKIITHWDEVIEDLTGLIETLDLKNIVGIGHSMGGHVLIGAASRMEDRFKSLVTIDPVIHAENLFDETAGMEGNPEDHPTARRRREFASPEEMADRLRDKGSFGLFDPEMLMDYCRYGLLPNEAGPGYVLACPPEVEASVYMSSRSNARIYKAVRSLKIPVVILRAKEPSPDRNIMDFSSSPTWPGLVHEFANARELYFPDKTHFIPMQIPETVIEVIEEEVNKILRLGEQP